MLDILRKLSHQSLHLHCWPHFHFHLPLLGLRTDRILLRVAFIITSIDHFQIGPIILLFLTSLTDADLKPEKLYRNKRSKFKVDGFL